MPPLQRAVAIPTVDHSTLLVGEDLNLDVAWPLDELLDVDAGVLERRIRLVAGHLQGGGKVALVATDPHPLAAAPGGRLDEHGIADLAGEPHGLGIIGHDAVGARD